VPDLAAFSEKKSESPPPASDPLDLSLAYWAPLNFRSTSFASICAKIFLNTPFADKSLNSRNAVCTRLASSKAMPDFAEDLNTRFGF